MKLTTEQLKQNAAAMIAYAEGRPIEYQQEGIEKWWPANDIQGIGTTFLYRPKPEPKTRPWSKPEDVPPLCWLRATGQSAGSWLVVCICNMGVYITPAVTTRPMKEWAEIGRDYEYSTDRKTWQPCTVTEP